jgi:predicted RNA binding protein YcfA (HicA-like mRNA interferase family)
MKMPRNLSGTELITALEKLGYLKTRQAGSHVRLLTSESGEHHLTVPLHDPLRVGTLSAILADVAQHHAMTREELLSKLFDRD